MEIKKIDMKNKYLKVISRFCYGLFYYKEQYRFSVNFDRTLRICLAVITASSVASWSIWEKLSILWSVIIGISQVALIVSAMLPYKDRIPKLRELKAALADIYEDMENQWFDVCEKKIKEDKLNDLISEYKERWRKAEAKYLKDDSLPRWRWMINRAKNNAVAYISDVLLENECEAKNLTHEDPTIQSLAKCSGYKLSKREITKIAKLVIKNLPQINLYAEQPTDEECVEDEETPAQ